MMVKLKKFTAVFSIITMIAALIPVTAGARTVGKGECGDNLTWVLDSEGTLTISGTGEMWEWDSSFWTRSKVKKVIITEGVENIGAEAFYKCYELESVTIPDTVHIIGFEAFYECVLLESVTIPDGVTSIEYGAFSRCTSLKSVIIPSSMKYIDEEIFYRCFNLQSVTIPDTVISIYADAFFNCNSLSDVYYGGSEDEWRNIFINFGNDSLIKAEKHFGRPNIEPTKTPDGNIIGGIGKYEQSIETKKEIVGGVAVFTVTELKDAESLEGIALFVAEYDKDGVMTDVKKVYGEIDNNALTIEADIPKSESYKFMLWDKDNNPVIKAITEF